MRDESAIGAIAARELLESGYASYAFVPCFDNPLWSRDRGKGFAAIIGAAGLRIAVCAAGAQALASMPKPIGVFVANDIAAANVLRVCRELGLRVPETVAVIGVDDERNLCEFAKPTLSSIAIDLEREGEAAMPHGHPLADRETMTTTVSGSGFRCSFHQSANHNPSPTIQSTGRQTMNADGPRGCG